MYVHVYCESTVLDKLYHWNYAEPAENRLKSLSAGRPKSDFDGHPNPQKREPQTAVSLLFELLSVVHPVHHLDDCPHLIIPTHK